MNSSASHAHLRLQREQDARERLANKQILVVQAPKRTGWACEALEAAGCTVTSSDSCLEASRELSQAQFDGIIVDAFVPDCGHAHDIRQADKDLAAFVLGRSQRDVAKIERAFQWLGRVRILDRPAPTYELLEMAARTVRRTARARGLDPLAGEELATAPPSLLPCPQPDQWSARDVRMRVRSLHDVVGLTDRETQIIRGVVRRMNNPDIANQLSVSLHLVKKVVHHLIRKLELESRAEIAWLLVSLQHQEELEDQLDRRYEAPLPLLLNA